MSENLIILWFINIVNYVWLKVKLFFQDMHLIRKELSNPYRCPICNHSLYEPNGICTNCLKNESKSERMDSEDLMQWIDKHTPEIKDIIDDSIEDEIDIYLNKTYPLKIRKIIDFNKIELPLDHIEI